jgi:hypothetical protein
MMSTCSPSSTDLTIPDDRYSLHQECIAEAERHKWIESEKAGHDLGAEAIRCWVRKHWNGYLRDRWLEHLEGKRFWIELDLDDFGLLNRRFASSPFIGEIIQQLKDKGENLSIILWAIQERHPIEEILTILLALDINSSRIECKLEENLVAHHHG